MALLLTAWGKNIAKEENAYNAYWFIVGLIIINIGIYIWIKRGIKAAYIHWAKDNNKKLYQQNLIEKDNEIKRLTELSNTLRSANHNIIHRLTSLERNYLIMMKKLCEESHIELSHELALSLEDVKRTITDYQRDVGDNKKAKIQSSTKIKMLDDLFALFLDRCTDSNIDFNIITTGSIPYMVENMISQSKLEILIGDLLQNAVIAVNASDNLFRSILVTIGLAGDHYALTIYDSGIPFEIDTLICLGTKHITTHSDTGGSGEGFMKIFKTIQEHNASLTISENRPGHAGYSKSIIIRFDDNAKFIIETYRPNDFPSSKRYLLKSFN